MFYVKCMYMLLILKVSIFFMYLSVIKKSKFRIVRGSLFRAAA